MAGNQCQVSFLMLMVVRPFMKFQAPDLTLVMSKTSMAPLPHLKLAHPMDHQTKVSIHPLQTAMDPHLSRLSHRMDHLKSTTHTGLITSVRQTHTVLQLNHLALQEIAMDHHLRRIMAHPLLRIRTDHRKKAMDHHLHEIIMGPLKVPLRTLMALQSSQSLVNTQED
jgi:hypothetical protein